MSPTELIELAEIQRNLEQLKPVFKYVRPLSASAESLLEVMDDRSDRYLLGLPAVDLLTRGFGPGEFVLVVGFAHSAKTQLVLTSILHNRHRRVLVASADDSSEMLLMKLYCMYHGVSASGVEQEIRNGMPETRDKLVEFARNTLSNLVIVDDPLSLRELDHVVEEATEFWGASPELVVFDYLQLLQGEFGDGNSVSAQANALKTWAKPQSFPLMVLHQGTRSGAKPGVPITMTSGAYGGEQQATILIGVRRKKDDAEADSFQRERHQNTVTLHVVKNKRAGGRTTGPDGIDFHLVPETGLIRALPETWEPGSQNTRDSGSPSTS